MSGERVPAPGPSYVREEQVRLPGQPEMSSVELGMSAPSIMDDGWWLTHLWAADADGVVEATDAAPLAGPPPGPPLLTMGPALAGALAGLLDQEDGRQLIRLRMPPADDAARPWARPLLLMTAVRWDPDPQRHDAPQRAGTRAVARVRPGRGSRGRAGSRPRLSIADAQLADWRPGCARTAGRDAGAVVGAAGAVVAADPVLWLLGIVGFGARGGLVLLTLPVLTIPSPVLLSILFRNQLDTAGTTASFDVLAVIAAGLTGVLALLAIVISAWAELNAVERCVAAPRSRDPASGPLTPDRWRQPSAARCCCGSRRSRRPAWCPS